MITLTDLQARIVRVALRDAHALACAEAEQRGDADAGYKHSARPIAVMLTNAIGIIEARIDASVKPGMSRG